MKIRTEISKIKNRKTNENKSYFFEKTDIINTFLARMTLNKHIADILFIMKDCFLSPKKREQGKNVPT